MTRFVYRVAMLLFTFAISAQAAHAGTTSAGPTVSIPQLATAPHVIGVIDASWDGAAKINLGYDYQYRRRASEPTTVYVAQSADALYFAWDVHQRDPLTIGQTTNGGAVFNDDHVAMALYPQGATGFSYIFRSNVNGARDQSSSENSAYAPQWESAGHRTAYGYQITERIPLNVIRSGGSPNWRAQFVRIESVSGSRDVWAYDPQMQYDIDVNYIGTLNGINVPQGAARPPARVQLYSLGEFASPSAGGSTSRMGADFSVPVTPTASFVATLHPDYSNVEVDQQSIAPLEFPRYYQEVRPFFTQIGSQFNGHFGCWNCPTTLYTPSIPAFSQGYAIEGTQGPSSFGAFDAIGPQRSDDAQAFGLFKTGRDTQAGLNIQRVSVNTPDMHDVSTTVSGGYSFLHNHVMAFTNLGNDRGSFVSDTSRGGYQEYGLGVMDQTSNFTLDYQHIGSQFNPLDGYVSHPGIRGLLASAGKTFNYSPKSAVQQLSLNGSWDHYDGEDGQANQSDQSLSVYVKTRSQFAFSLSSGSSYLLVPDGEMLPFDQNGASVSYRANTPTGSFASYSQGRYYHGFLNGWYTGTGVRLAKPLILSVQLDTTHYVPDAAYSVGTAFNEIAANELLERASLDWQFSHKASMDIGVRRIAGIVAPAGFGYAPTVGTPSIDAMNLTGAFHFLTLHNEFYFVYGDPSRLSTQHALFLKWIRYIGAPKGT